ncbi:Eco57I restriction-modification methylase domain-containing protein [Natronococcus sp. A-GB7]|uniref:Eco57I restriction-modification methylase domain-containing protein n=1 Tax=Natronococcus sp. A-GB7 TaxID=3037649 RepID=UPI00241D8D0D|nr:Eco57I restriction-modification methylase domain-containing protein [Natronococcus sp. A-GB7]MDG5821429.1 Eco57I restriction-modification methylase domain-containing protein [Natronococcus sp. A-GB7]
MKGHVTTPSGLADRMVAKLFADHEPESGDRILFPGIGSNAPFIHAVKRWCDKHDAPMPEAVAVELDPVRIDDVEENLEDVDVDVQERDFLESSIPRDLGEFDYIIGNPPYVPVTQLNDGEKEQYGEEFDTAWRRFDLYILFFERGLELLADNGRLVYVTPEKFEYISSGDALRELLTNYHVQEINHIDQDWFPDLKVYPAITVIDATESDRTHIVTRTNEERTVSLPTDGSSWAAPIRGGIDIEDTGVTLSDITVRISAGLATGRDSLFVSDKDDVAPQLIEEGWAYPTVSGKQLRTHDCPYTDDLILCPYDERGNLVSENELGAYGDWAEIHRETLEERSCVQKRNRPWYDWHNAPPMPEMLRPKIVCKDVAKEPEFWGEPEGTVIPRHSVYYIVPKSHIELDNLLTYLNSEEAKKWIEANAQKAYTDHVRIQSEMIEDLPIPKEFAETMQTSLV